MKKILTILFCGIMMISFSQKTWDGEGDAYSWSDDLNWSDDTPPISTDDVFIGSYIGVDVDATVASITFTADDAGMSLDGTGSTLTITGDVDFDNYICDISFSTTDYIKIGGNFLNKDNSSLTKNADLFDAAGIVEYNGSSGTQYIWGTTYGKLILSGNSTKEINEDMTITSRGVTGGTGRTCFSVSGGSVTFGANQLTTFSIESGSGDGTGSPSVRNARKFQDIPALNFQNLSLFGTRATSKLTFASTGTTKIGEVLTLSSTYSGAGSIVMTGSTIEFSSTSDPQPIPLTYSVGNLPYNNVTLTGSGVKSINGDLPSIVTGTLTLNTPSVNYNGTSQSVIAGTYDQLNLAGSGTKTISGTVTAANTTVSGGVTVDYTGASVQTILPATYSTLNFSGAGQKNVSGTVSATTLNANASTVSVTGTLISSTLNANSSTISISGTLTSTTFNAGTSTLDYSAAGNQTVADLAYNNLILSNSGNKTISAPLSVNNLTTSGTAVLVTGTNNVTVAGDFTNGGTLTKTSGDLSITGNYVNNGTLTLNDGILKFGGSASTAFSGSTPVTAKFVEVTKTSNTLTLSNTLNIDVEGTFTITNTSTTVASGGNLVLKSSSASNYATIPEIQSGSSITGNVTVQAYIAPTKRTWWHLSNPVASVAASQWQDDFAITGPFTGANTLDGVNLQSMYTYDETNTSSNMDIGWLSFPASSNTETMTVGKGYRAYIRDSKTTFSDKELDVTGSLNQGSIVVNLTSTASSDANSDGWNFVGNPYPSTIDWTTDLQTDLLDINAYVWNANTQAYSTITTNDDIAPFQGFWVQVNTGGGTLAFEESMKTNGGKALQRPALVENKITINLVDKNVDNAFNNSSTSLVIHADATNGFDKNFEASYLSRNLTSNFGDPILADIASIAVGGKKLKTNYIPESENEQLIPLYVVFASAKDYSLELTAQEFTYGGDVVLVDSYLKKEIVFSDAMVYDFSTTSAAASKASDRFKIKVGAKPVGVFGNVENISNVSLYPNPAVNQVNIKVVSASSKVEIDVLDALGNKVYTESINNSLSSFEKGIDVSKFAAGMYFVNVTQNGNVDTLKFIIK